MGLKGVCKFFTHRILEAVVVILIILLLPHLPPYTTFSESFRVTFKRLEGKLALNEKLNDAEIWHKGNFIGPEAFADYNGELYTGLIGGDIVKLTGNHITPVAKIGKPCKGYHEESICGRPLGMEFDQNGALIVADTYYGIFKVNVKTGEKERLVSLEEEIGGAKPKLPNGVALASNGDIFWSDSSIDFSLQDGIFVMLADPSGRLIHYDAKTKINKVLIDKLHFANGVALSQDEDFVIVAETAKNRIQRYHLKGGKKGTSDIFIDGLPGLPDNLKSDGQGGFFVPIVFAADEDHPSLAQVVSPFPLIRKFVARVFGLSQLAFESLNKVYPCEFADRAVHFIGHFTSVSSIVPPHRQTILHVSGTGEVLESLHSLDKKISHISEVHVLKDTLYLGSPFNDYIGKIPLSKIGWEKFSHDRRKREVPVEQAKPPKPTQAPTTTPPPPPPPTTTAPPKQHPPQKQQTPPPPKQQTPPTQQTPPPPKQQTKQQTPPPKQQTPPPKQQTPPPKQQTPPPKQQTPPPKQQTPPPKQQTPPPKQQTPPPKQQTPPPKQQTPPPKQQQAPPAKQTPPARQSAPPVAQSVKDQAKSVPVREAT